MTLQETRWLPTLSREWLKGLAMLFMVFDHAYMTVVNVAGYQWMTQIGRIAFPIFAFQIAEGYAHTSSKNKYLLNMLIFALISEIPYNLMMGGEVIGPFHQNVMFTFLIALVFLKFIDKVLLLNIHWAIKAVFIGGICTLSVVVGTLTFVDYSGFGVLTVLIFYIAKLMPKQYMTITIQVLGLWMINYIYLGGKVIILPGGYEFPEQAFALLSLLFIWMYSGKKSLKGKSEIRFKYFAYLFYPAHILALSLISLYLL
ncbi:MAG: TraX family protein [Oscillospiraceae bacterium]